MVDPASAPRQQRRSSSVCRNRRLLSRARRIRFSSTRDYNPISIASHPALLWPPEYELLRIARSDTST